MSSRIVRHRDSIGRARTAAPAWRTTLLAIGGIVLVFAVIFVDTQRGRDDIEQQFAHSGVTDVLRSIAHHIGGVQAGPQHNKHQ
jgi:hypothetical protein